MTDTSPLDGHTILKVLVGSHAHGLAGPLSDRDYRRVYVMPTANMFRLSYKLPGTHCIQGTDDETAWELGPFLSLADRCHPLVLETFLAPTICLDSWGEELRSLFPAVWSPQRVYDSFLGYALNQRTKFLEKKEGRPAKYASTYLRILHNLCELLDTGTFTIRIAETPIGPTIARVKAGVFRTGEVIDLAEQWTQEAARSLARCTHRADRQVIDAFLIRIRSSFLFS